MEKNDISVVIRVYKKQFSNAMSSTVLYMCKISINTTKTNMASTGEPVVKKRKYKVKFNDSWCESYPISKVNDNPHAFYCIPCKRSLSCGHMGISDVKDHCQGANHKKMSKQSK